MAHFPEQAQDDVYGQDHNTMISAVIGPRGKAIRQADGSYILNGFWPFGSGCQLSKWLLLGAEVFDEKGEFLDLADLLIPTTDAEIHKRFWDSPITSRIYSFPFPAMQQQFTFFKFRETISDWDMPIMSWKKSLISLVYFFQS